LRWRPHSPRLRESSRSRVHRISGSQPTGLMSAMVESGHSANVRNGWKADIASSRAPMQLTRARFRQASRLGLAECE
ncbi:MAG: hypothetical protein ABJB40_10300, partial [Acidobacteriota bacterium]